MVGQGHDGADHDIQAADFVVKTVVQEVGSESEAGVVDEEVDGSQVRLLAVGRPSHVEAGGDARAAGVGGQVGGDHLSAHAGDVRERVRERAQGIFATRNEHQVVARGGQLPTEFFTNAGGRSGDQRCSHGGSLAPHGARSTKPGRDARASRPGLACHRVRIRYPAPPPARAAGMTRRTSQ